MKESINITTNWKPIPIHYYRGADKSLARPGRKQARKHVRDARNFNNIETQAVIKLFSLQGKVPKEIHAILTETLDCFLPGRAMYLSAPPVDPLLQPVNARRLKQCWPVDLQGT